MGTIMPRKAAEFWWNIPLKDIQREKVIIPPEVSYYTRDESNKKWIPITWKEVFAKRKERQDSNIQNKISYSYKIKPCYIWVFYNHTFLFHGWFIYIKIFKKNIAINFRQHGRYDNLIQKIMNTFPCGIIPFDFKTWAETFERIHHRDFKDERRKKNALLKCWCLIDERGDIADIYPLNRRHEKQTITFKNHETI